jgi:hypothetical protein
MLESGSIEVKSTLSSARFNATISSLEQLDDTMHGPIILAALRFTNNYGMTLPEHISAIQNTIELKKICWKFLIFDCYMLDTFIQTLNTIQDFFKTNRQVYSWLMINFHVL